MRANLALLAVASLACCSCGSSRARTVCTGGVDGPVLDGAALFELDDYGDNNHCAGADVVDSSIAPSTRRSFAAGAPISLDLAPGPHTLVLRAYADSAGANPIGSGCAEVRLAAGADVCIDLSLTAVDDGSVRGDGGAPDFAGCVLGSVDNCGGCGVPCDSVHSVGAACNGGACTFSGCSANHVDCRSAPPNFDGCECEGNGCCNGACQTKHSNGLGESFFDCAALGTEDATQVAEAAAAWDATGIIDMPRNYSDNKGSANYICDQSTKRNACACWTWNGTGQYGGPGRALATSGKSTQCFIPLGTTYAVWN